MKYWIIALALWILLCPGSFGHVKKSLHRSGGDPLYSTALATANRFLHAWQSEDHETGIVMLSDSAREHASAEKLQNFFSPGANAAYEISRGKRVKADEYSFPVVLFGRTEASVRPRACRIVVSRDSRGDWSVNNIP
jgi:hypothetical protein